MTYRSKAVISGWGVEIPPEENIVTNQELVDSFNIYCRQFNETYKDEIEAGKIERRDTSSVEFIENASGIRERRYFIKEGALDPKRMKPKWELKHMDDDSNAYLFCRPAVEQALRRANKSITDIGAIVCASTVPERQTPPISVEIATKMGALSGIFCCDTQYGCASFVNGMEIIKAMIDAETIQCGLIVGYEFGSSWGPLTKRDVHFVFADAAGAMVIENANNVSVVDKDSNPLYRIQSSHHSCELNNAIYGEMTTTTVCKDVIGTGLICEENFIDDHNRNFKGKAVFKGLTKLVNRHAVEHALKGNIQIDKIKKYWMHQANGKLNTLIVKKITGTTPSDAQVPSTYQWLGNTVSVSFLTTMEFDEKPINRGEQGLICVMGAGFTAATMVVERI